MSANIEALKKDITRRMDGAVEVLGREFGGVRTGRANASLLEPVVVKAYGSEMPLNQVGTISVPEPRLLTVQVWDRGVVPAVQKAMVAMEATMLPPAVASRSPAAVTR